MDSDRWSDASVPLQLIQHAGLQSLPLCLQMADRRSVHSSFLLSLLLLELAFAQCEPVAACFGADPT